MRATRLLKNINDQKFDKSKNLLKSDESGFLRNKKEQNIRYALNCFEIEIEITSNIITFT